ncbi:MAG TPA: hypothetical protein VF070_37980 [Streptosporangiaceae bacterium]
MLELREPLVGLLLLRIELLDGVREENVCEFGSQLRDPAASDSDSVSCRSSSLSRS